uniref:Retrotransposon-related protein n=1 Tax=Tanacetum cinerariifolium TaxID=118510 RepID=A0A6L2KL77_TANCI|nr:retrotransposon-related protein [Tanacetum cinerariifolium]
MCTDVFEVLKKLPPMRSHDHKIPLVPGTQPVNIRPYRHPHMQKDAIEAMVKELLETRVIKHRQSSFTSPVVMVKKKDNSWRMCVDYRQLNKNTIKDKFLILIIKELIDELNGAVLKIKVNEFSKIMGNVLIPENKVKGVTTRRINMMFEATPSKEINETRINKNEPPKFKHDVQEKPHDVGVENKSSIIPERTTQPWLKSNFNDDESWYADFVNYIVGKSFHQTGHLKKERGGVFGTCYLNSKGAKDPTKVHAMQNWLVPKNIKQVRGFLGLISWETAKYRKIWYDEDVYDLRSIETEFPAIVFNDNLTSDKTLSCEPTVSSLNDNKIDFRISFDESDDEDYTVVFDKNLFSYKIISANDLKTDSKNDNEKVNMPLFSSIEHSVCCIDDLDFFKDFENEFPAIVYNDALTSKSDFLTKPTLCPQHIDEFNLKDETSLSECDKKEQNVLYFNDLFPFNVIYLDDLKSNKDNDDDKIDIKQSSRDMSIIPLPNVINIHVGAYARGSNMLLETSHDTSNKIFKTETFIKEFNVNIVAFYTTYSLNEYSVYRYQYDVSWGMDTAYQLPVQF